MRRQRRALVPGLALHARLHHTLSLFEGRILPGCGASVTIAGVVSSDEGARGGLAGAALARLPARGVGRARLRRRARCRRPGGRCARRARAAALARANAASLRRLLVPLAAAGLPALLAALLEDPLLLLFVPVLVNLGLLVAFARSLWRGPPVIESLARLQVGDLSDAEVRYCRSVTGIWCVFFVANASADGRPRAGRLAGGLGAVDRRALLPRDRRRARARAHGALLALPPLHRRPDRRGDAALVPAALVSRSSSAPRRWSASTRAMSRSWRRSAVDGRAISARSVQRARRAGAAGRRAAQLDRLARREQRDRRHRLA